jgi:hypothetical protein
VKQGVLGFLLGCVVVGAVLGIYASGLKAELSAAQKEGQIQQAYTQHGDQAKIQAQQSQLQQMTEQRDACQVKFQRATFLYETPLLGGPTRLWAIPADIEPVYLGSKHGAFSHYDPKTQMETVQLQAKTK